MTNQVAATLLIQLYADFSILCSARGDKPNEGTAEAIAVAVQALQEVE